MVDSANFFRSAVSQDSHVDQLPGPGIPGCLVFADPWKGLSSALPSISHLPHIRKAPKVAVLPFLASLSQLIKSGKYVNHETASLLCIVSPLFWERGIGLSQQQLP